MGALVVFPGHHARRRRVVPAGRLTDSRRVILPAHYRASRIVFFPQLRALQERFAMEANISLQPIRQESRTDESGNQVTTYTVVFTVGDDGPFEATFDAHTFNPAEVEGRVKDIAAKMKTIRQSFSF